MVTESEGATVSGEVGEQSAGVADCLPCLAPERERGVKISRNLGPVAAVVGSVCGFDAWNPPFRGRESPTLGSQCRSPVYREERQAPLA